MKVLIICSRRYYAPYTDYVAPFIYEQVQALRARGVECRYFLIMGGWRGYLRALPALRQELHAFCPDLVHAHSGLCGFVAAAVVSKSPLVITFHGSDINLPSVRRLSRWAMKRASHSIFVSKQLQRLGGSPNNSSVIPCAVDTQEFKPMPRDYCRQMLKWDSHKTYILFSKEFADKVKNYPLAKQTMASFPEAELVELYGYDRRQMVWLYNACDAALMTSFSEGSPQFIKEAVACGCPVVSTDVGDVSEVIAGVSNCFLSSYDPSDVVAHLRQALAIGHLPTSGLRPEYTTEHVTTTLYQLYQTLCQK